MTCTPRAIARTTRTAALGLLGLPLGFLVALLVLVMWAWTSLLLPAGFALSLAVVTVLAWKVALPESRWLAVCTLLGGVLAPIAVIWLTVQVVPDW